MQQIRVRNRFIRVQVKPALVGNVPGDRQGLQAPVLELDQVLLQRCNAKRIGDAEFLKLAIGIVCFCPVPAIAFEKQAGDAVLLKCSIVKIGQHGIGSRVLHGEIMVRARPGFRFSRMTALAGIPTDVNSFRQRLARTRICFVLGGFTAGAE